jgi:hypothetical protein
VPTGIFIQIVLIGHLHLTTVCILYVGNMKLAQLFALLPLSLAIAQSNRPRKMCGNTDMAPPAALKEIEGGMKSGHGSVAEEAQAIAAAAPRNITTYMHIVTRDEASYRRRINQTMINQQVAIINNAYSNTGFQFNIQVFAWLTPSDHPNWIFGNDTNEVTNMKNVLRNGTYRDLNLYFLPNFTQGSGDNAYLGICTYPALQNPNPPRSDYVYDGCLLDYDTVRIVSRKPSRRNADHD